jgi:hypothetical protein
VASDSLHAFFPFLELQSVIACYAKFHRIFPFCSQGLELLVTDLRAGLATEETPQHAFSSMAPESLWKATEHVAVIIAGDAAGVPLLPPRITESDFDAAVRLRSCDLVAP